MKIKQWVLAAALMISGLGVLTSCEKIEEANQDVLCQWITLFAEEGIASDTGLAYNQVAEVMEFFGNGTGYYECYLLNGDELVGAPYVRGENGNFRYEVEGGLDLRSTVAQKNAHVHLDITMFLRSEFYYWSVRYADGVIIDDNGCVFTPATAAQQAQILQWYESRNVTGLSEKILGKWMKVEKDGQPMPTNEKMVYTFVSATEAYVSASLEARPVVGTEWIDKLEADVTISGNKVTLTSLSDDGAVMVVDFVVTSIDDTRLTAQHRAVVTQNGVQTYMIEDVVSLDKVTADYSADIVGTWEGRCTSEGSVFDDGQEHRWEYKADGTYVYYMKDGDQWVPSQDPLNEYFVDGNLLCTRWKNAGQETENREWWEIAIEGDTMNWFALRQNPDGTTFTATFEMSKVE